MIEADFQREYNIDLARQFYSLSWRRFLVLLGGLGLNSTLVNVLSSKQSNENIITDPVVAERAVKRIWGV